MDDLFDLLDDGFGNEALCEGCKATSPLDCARLVLSQPVDHLWKEIYAVDDYLNSFTLRRCDVMRETCKVRVGDILCRLRPCPDCSVSDGVSAFRISELQALLEFSRWQKGAAKPGFLDHMLEVTVSINWDITNLSFWYVNIKIEYRVCCNGRTKEEGHTLAGRTGIDGFPISRIQRYMQSFPQFPGKQRFVDMVVAKAEETIPPELLILSI